MAHDASTVTPKSLVLRAREPEQLCCFVFWISSHSYNISYSEARKTYRAIFSEPRIVVPRSSSESVQRTERSGMIARTHAQFSTSNVPPATEPSAPGSVAHPSGKTRDGHPATKKRRRQPDADAIGSADVPDGAPARKKTGKLTRKSQSLKTIDAAL